ncbi:MAG: hypothetical protein H8D34_27585, partial [Chloroflexi bacterium]|nr:hypothetical protein [Chloroflexota bacterium]
MNEGDLTLGGAGMAVDGEIFVSTTGTIDAAAPVRASGPVNLTAFGLDIWADVEGDPVILNEVPDPHFFVGGTLHTYLTIQAAIDAVAGGLTPDNDVIYVEGGTFNEEVNLIGLDTDLTLVGGDGGGTSTLAEAITIANNGVAASRTITLRNFTITNSLIAIGGAVGLDLVLDQVNLLAASVNIIGAAADDSVVINLSGSAGAAIVFDGGLGTDSLTVNDASGADLSLNITSGTAIAASGAWTTGYSNVENVQFSGGTGDDTITLNGYAAAGSLTLDGGAGHDSVTVAGNVALSGGGALNVSAETITVPSGMVISSDAGNIELVAVAQDESTVTDTGDLENKAAQVIVEGKIETGGNVNLHAEVVRDIDIVGLLVLEVTSISDARVAVRNVAELIADTLQISATTQGSVVSEALGWEVTNIFTENAAAFIEGGSVVNVGGLSLTATSATEYTATGRNASNRITGDPHAYIDGSAINAGAGGVSVIARDTATLSAISPELEIDLGIDLPVSISWSAARNYFNRNTEAYISNSQVIVSDGGDVEVKAERDLQVSTIARASSLVTSAPLPDGYSISIGGTYASNTLLGDVSAFIINSSVQTSGAGGVLVDARDTSAVDSRAEISQKAELGSYSINDIAATLGVSLAFNALGWDPGNFLFAAIDALIGTQIGTEQPLNTLAYIQDSTVTVSGSGNLSVTALSSVQLNATVSNVAETTASGLYGASGMSVGAIIASNMVSSTTKAFVKDSNPADGVATSLNVGGDVRVSAQDDSGIHSNVKIVSSAVTTNDGGTAVLDAAIGNLMPADFTTGDGTQEIDFGEKVRLSDDYAGGGDPNGIYTYMGTTTTLDLGSVNYANLDYWKEAVDTQLIPEGVNFSESDSIAVGGLVSRNDVRSQVESAVIDSTVVAASLGVTALSDAVIRSQVDSVVESSGGSSFGEGTSLAANGVIATNLVLSKANAFIRGSSITTTGDLLVEAQNTSLIEANVESLTTSGDTAVGATMAFNTIGFAAQNILFQIIDTLIGTDIGGEQPAEVKAFIENSIINAGGNLTVDAQGKAQLFASVVNDATSAASAIVNASGMAVGALLVSNMVSSMAQAYIYNPNERKAVVAGGTVTVRSADTAFIDATTLMIAVSTTTNDAGASLLGAVVDDFSNYAFTSNSGLQTLQPEDAVRVSSGYLRGGVGGGVYRYIGGVAALDLGKQNYADTSRWERITASDLSVIIANMGNVTDSDSIAVGGMVVRNDVRGNVDAYLQNVSVSAAGISVTALEDATLQALIEGVVTSSGGSMYGSGTSLAVNASIATNSVLGRAQAYVANSTLTTTSGDVVVDAQNTSGMNAKVVSVTETGDTAVGVVLAFNTVGFEAQNMLFKAIEALLGLDMGEEDPPATLAYLQNTDVNSAGGVRVNATNAAFLNATVSNAARSVASALYGASGMSVGAVLALNLVKSSADAHISGSNTLTAVGDLLVSADDTAQIDSNVKIVASSITTNDGGAAMAKKLIAQDIDVEYLSTDGLQEVEFGDKVRLSDGHAAGGSPGSVYIYMGTTATIDLNAENYSKLGYWKEDPKTKLIPQGNNISASDSNAIGFVLAVNTLDSESIAYIENATVNAGTVTVSALEAASLNVETDAFLESSGGSVMGEGSSLAVGGAIALNKLISDATAYITDASITTTAGDVLVEARNGSVVDALTKAAITTGADAVGVVVAFNIMGFEAPTLLNQSIDAWMGDKFEEVFNLHPARARAFIEDTSVTSVGAINVRASNEATLNAA